MVPNVSLSGDQWSVHIPGDDPVQLSAGDLPGLRATLASIQEHHETNGRMVLIPSSRVPYDHVIAAMDAARGDDSALFPHVVIAGGVD